MWVVVIVENSKAKIQTWQNQTTKASERKIPPSPFVFHSLDKAKALEYGNFAANIVILLQSLDLLYSRKRSNFYFSYLNTMEKGHG